MFDGESESNVDEILDGEDSDQNMMTTDTSIDSEDKSTDPEDDGDSASGSDSGSDSDSHSGDSHDGSNVFGLPRARDSEPGNQHMRHLPTLSGSDSLFVSPRQSPGTQSTGDCPVKKEQDEDGRNALGQSWQVALDRSEGTIIRCRADGNPQERHGSLRRFGSRGRELAREGSRESTFGGQISRFISDLTGGDGVARAASSRSSEGLSSAGPGEERRSSQVSEQLMDDGACDESGRSPGGVKRSNDDSTSSENGNPTDGAKRPRWK
jgi:hypothetical protein